MVSGNVLLRRLAYAAALGSLVALLVGYWTPPAIDGAIHQAVLENVVWRPDSPPEVDARYRGLQDPNGLPDYFRVWMFNLTNLPDVRRGAKPKLVEVGPLTYIKHRVKVDARWDRNGRVAVKEWDYHVFQPNLSAANPNDTIVTLNLPLLGVLEILHAYSASVPSVRTLIDVLVGVLSGWRDEHVDGLFTKRTAGELMWGYEDLLLKRLAMLLGTTFVRSTTVRLVPNDTSAEQVLATQNASLIDTGWRPGGRDGDGGAAGGRRGGASLRRRGLEYDTDKIWNMEEEAGWTAVTSWGPNCTEPVRGTDAFQFRPGLDRGSRLRVWITELFRSAELIYLTDVELHGVRMLRFEPDPRESEPDPCHHQRIRGLANVTVPAAVGPTGNGSSEAAHGVPLLLSLPHYCKVDETVAAALDGVECDPELHHLFVDVEPITGATMRAAKRLQLSSQLTHSARAVLEPTIGTSYILPIFWAEEASQISAVQAASFRHSVYRAQRVAAATGRASYVAAAALAAAAAAAGVAAVLLARPRAQGRVGTGSGVAGSGAANGSEASLDVGTGSGATTGTRTVAVSDGFPGPPGRLAAAGQQRQQGRQQPAGPGASTALGPDVPGAAGGLEGGAVDGVRVGVGVGVVAAAVGDSAVVVAVLDGSGGGGGGGRGGGGADGDGDGGDLRTPLLGGPR